jgi:hypothetical protein
MEDAPEPVLRVLDRHSPDDPMDLIALLKEEFRQV